jgi:hypothetical protein
MSFIIVFLLILAGLANLYFRLRSRHITDEQLLQCWAEYGTGRLMLANQNGITNPVFLGNPAEIPPGEFVVRETGTRKQMLDVWWKVYYTKKWFPKTRTAKSADTYALLWYIDDSMPVDDRCGIDQWDDVYSEYPAM